MNQHKQIHKHNPTHFCREDGSPGLKISKNAFKFQLKLSDGNHIFGPNEPGSCWSKSSMMHRVGLRAITLIKAPGTM